MNYLHKLKFTDKEEFDGLLTVTELSQYGELMTNQPKWVKQIETIVHIGIITKPATYDEEGNELTPPTTVEGYHVDILAHDEVAALRPYLVKAPNPVHGYGWAEPNYLIVAPTSDWTKAEIQVYMTNSGIPFSLGMTKAQLLAAI